MTERAPETADALPVRPGFHRIRRSTRVRDAALLSFVLACATAAVWLLVTVGEVRSTAAGAETELPASSATYLSWADGSKLDRPTRASRTATDARDAIGASGSATMQRASSGASTPRARVRAKKQSSATSSTAPTASTSTPGAGTSAGRGNATGQANGTARPGTGNGSKPAPATGNTASSGNANGLHKGNGAAASAKH